MPQIFTYWKPQRVSGVTQNTGKALVLLVREGGEKVALVRVAPAWLEIEHPMVLPQVFPLASSYAFYLSTLSHPVN